jgi:hypothetical protein
MRSWYGTKFHGQYTSNGEPYDVYTMTAAHKTLADSLLRACEEPRERAAASWCA